MVKLESKAFELKQENALNSEIKAVLDSWVRYENSLREREQKKIAEHVISRIQAQLQDPKMVTVFSGPTFFLQDNC